MERRLYRSQSDRIIWGVCGGLAEYFDFDPTIVRIIAVLLALASGAGILAYIILAIVIPLESSRLTEPKDVIKENVEDMKETASQLGQKIRSTFASHENTSQEAAKARRRRRNILGIILIVIGILFSLANFNLLWWLRWSYLWPLILIGIGLLIILGVRRKIAVSEEKRPRERYVPIWGIFLLFLGIVFLLQSLNVLPWTLWGTLWRFWPVLIIVAGLGILLKGYNVWLVSVLIMAVLFACLGIAIWQYEPSSPLEQSTESYSEPLNGLEQAQIEMDFNYYNVHLTSLFPSYPCPDGG